MTINYAIFEHTADEGIIVYGPDFKAALKNTLLAFYDYMIGLENIEAREPFNWELAIENQLLKKDDYANIVVNLLSEALYYFETEGIMLAKLSLAFEDKKIIVQGYGEKFDINKHSFNNMIKAITYHCLEVVEDAGKCKIQVLFDL